MRKQQTALAAAAVLTLVPGLALVSGCGSASAGGAASTAKTPSATPSGATASHPASAAGGKTVTIDVRSLYGVGKVLVTGAGYALYVFSPDDHRAVTCTGACAGTWPPLMLPAGSGLSAGAGVTQSLLGSDPDPAGGRVVTYDGWPLYGYTGDVQPGMATGQDIDLNGGDWYVMQPSGQPLVPAP